MHTGHSRALELIWHHAVCIRAKAYSFVFRLSVRMQAEEVDAYDSQARLLPPVLAIDLFPLARS
jgi:hypothetical protein